MTDGARVTDYDRIADRFDTRYSIYAYDGVRDTLFHFLGADASTSVLEVGCGTGHWLAVAASRRTPSPGQDDRRPTAATRHSMIVGVDPSARMLAKAAMRTPPLAEPQGGADPGRAAKAPARRLPLVRARAEALPWRDATFDRIFCVNALHHFTDRARFFAEARRVLKPGGGLLTIGKDPHTEHDDWWVYQYFEETRAIDRERFARVRTLRGEMALAGFAWTESMEADHIEAVRPASEAIAAGVVDPSFTSQLTVLSDQEYAAGAEKLRLANVAAGGQLQLLTDIRLYATTAWV